jgi:hypothetical protein
MCILPSPDRKKRTGSGDEALRQGKDIIRRTAANRHRCISGECRDGAAEGFMRYHNKLPKDAQPKRNDEMVLPAGKVCTGCVMSVRAGTALRGCSSRWKILVYFIRLYGVSLNTAGDAYES